MSSSELTASITPDATLRVVRRARGTLVKFFRRSIAVIAAAALTLISGTAAVADTPQSNQTQLLDLVNCSNVTGDINFSPKLTAIPGIITMTGGTASNTCSSPSGITGYTLDFDATLIGGLCVPATGVILGTLNAGTMTAHWQGGSGAATTNFAWTVPAGLQLGADSSVIVLVGYSQAGRFHDAGTPAIVELTLTLANATPSCSLFNGPNHADFTNGSLLIADVI